MTNQEILYDFKACFKFITKAGTATMNYVDVESEAPLPISRRGSCEYGLV